ANSLLGCRIVPSRTKLNLLYSITRGLMSLVMDFFGLPSFCFRAPNLKLISYPFNNFRDMNNIWRILLSTIFAISTVYGQTGLTVGHPRVYFLGEPGSSMVQSVD